MGARLEEQREERATDWGQSKNFGLESPCGSRKRNRMPRNRYFPRGGESARKYKAVLMVAHEDRAVRDEYAAVCDGAGDCGSGAVG